ncbi:MAG: sulfotransferase domain-containing protein [Pirellulales bacterium]
MKPIFMTHHKCASAWLSDVFHDYYCVRRGLPAYATHRSDEFPPDAARFQFLIFGNASWNFLKDKVDRAVHIVRNPLAILVSSYFSHIKTHPIDTWPLLAKQRKRLETLDIRRGLVATNEFIRSRDGFHEGVVGPLAAMKEFDYDDDRVLTLRMEDVVRDPTPIFERIFEHFGEHMPEDFSAHVARHDFRAKSGGRAPGQASDAGSHYRSGDPNDWAKHLTLRFARQIYQQNRELMDRYYPETVEEFELAPAQGIIYRISDYVRLPRDASIASRGLIAHEPCAYGRRSSGGRVFFS